MPFYARCSISCSLYGTFLFAIEDEYVRYKGQITLIVQIHVYIGLQLIRVNNFFIHKRKKTGHSENKIFLIQLEVFLLYHDLI